MALKLYFNVDNDNIVYVNKQTPEKKKAKITDGERTSKSVIISPGDIENISVEKMKEIEARCKLVNETKHQIY